MQDTEFTTFRSLFFNRPKNVAFLIHSIDFPREARLLDPDGAKTDVLARRAKQGLEKTGKRSFFIDAIFDKVRLKAVGSFTVEFRGRVCHGVFIFVPYLPEEFQDPAKKQDILQALREAIGVARDYGAEYVGLGAFTSIVSANGLLLHDDSPLPITSGSSGTAVGNELGVLEGCRQLGINPRKSTLMVLGTGSVGAPTALLLVKRFRRLILCARGRTELEALRTNLIRLGCKANRIEINNHNFNEAARRADVLVLATSVASASQLALDPTAIRPGSLVLDAGRPRNFPPEAAAAASYLVIDGSILRFPGRIHDDAYQLVGMGQPNEAWGCLAETVFRGLDGEEASTSVGSFIRKGDIRDVVASLRQLGIKMRRCGFRLAALRSNDMALDKERIQAVRAIRRDRSKIRQNLQHIKDNLNANWERFAGRPNEQLGTP